MKKKDVWRSESQGMLPKEKETKKSNILSRNQFQLLTLYCNVANQTIFSHQFDFDDQKETETKDHPPSVHCSQSHQNISI